MFYIYRCTTQQLEDSLNRVVDAGDTVVQPVHTGGRDWIIVCRKGKPLSEQAPAPDLSSIDFAGRMKRAAAEGARKGVGDR